MADTRTEARPRAIHLSRSFTRMDPGLTSPTRKRASTLQPAGFPAVPDAKHWERFQQLNGENPIADVFENSGLDDEERLRDGSGAPTPDIQLPSTFDELPIEIRSLTERFLESLSAKVHPQPLTADGLAELFQDFYERASNHIATHIASLSSQIGREKSQAVSKGRSRAGSGAKRPDPAQIAGGGEMLTATEVADRRKARRLLELKRVALEEAVERAVVEKVYRRVWKHRSTDDAPRDEKLRSRAAALSLVGIGLSELRTEPEPSTDEMKKATREKEEQIYQSLSSAREALQKMDNEHYPLGKLRHLTEAHKNIVETLSQHFPSTSSADEILPTLIYTLITLPPEGVNAVSNLNFIQRFRCSSRVDGEAAYCLVNLEAAISFLETVDLSSLRAEELSGGPVKSHNQPATSVLEPQVSSPSKSTFAQAEISAVTATPQPSTMTDNTGEASKQLSTTAASLETPTTPTRPPMAHRRLSSMVQGPADMIEAGRHNFLNATDKIYDSINGSLENSLQFVFGRFKDQSKGDSPLPKTLEDARKLVSASSDGEEDDGIYNSGRSSPLQEDPLGSKVDSKLVDLIGGRKQLRDRSVDSTRSASSGKRVGFGDKTIREKAVKEEPPTAGVSAASATLLSTINPLNRFNVASLTRFARATSNPSPMNPSPVSEKSNKLAEIVESPTNDESTSSQRTIPKETSSPCGNEEVNAREALAELRRTKPPKKRFLEIQSAAELKLGEVEELLLEYRRLAKAIGEAVAQ